MMLSPGCLGAIDDLDDIDDDVLDPILDWLEGEYPRLDLPTRERTSPTLDIYNECEILLTDLQDSIYNEPQIDPTLGNYHSLEPRLLL